MLRVCSQCDRALGERRSNAVYCGPPCKQKAWRRRRAGLPEWARPYDARRGRLRLEQLSREEWEEDRQRRFWEAYRDAVRNGGYSERYDLTVIDVGELDD